MGTTTIWQVEAFNTATESENKIHDDSVARGLGFRGGLVPGVDVYAYLTHPPVEQWGLAWLERGSMHARFHQPVYDGEATTITCAHINETTLELTATNARDEVCATATAMLPSSALPPVGLDAYPRLPLPADPPAASQTSLTPGTQLGALEHGFHADNAIAYLANVRETLGVYVDDRIAHPGWLLRDANYVLAANVRLGPWIHVGSEVQNLGVVADGARLSIRGAVLANYERKGHELVELDLLMVADETRPVLHVHHTAIYRPRSA